MKFSNDKKKLTVTKREAEGKLVERMIYTISWDKEAVVTNLINSKYCIPNINQTSIAYLKMLHEDRRRLTCLLIS